MDRLTTDNPNGNTENALNLFYIKDMETWVRGGGPAPEYPDVRLVEYIRDIARKHGLTISLETADEDLVDELFDILLDGTDTIEGVVATLNTAAWAFAALRDRLKAYEDTGLTPERADDLAKADTDGHLLVLPCNVGDTVYMTTHNGKVVKGTVISFRFREKLMVDVEYNHFGTCATTRYWGETAFLTRKEAEAALEEKNEHLD